MLCQVPQLDRMDTEMTFEEWCYSKQIKGNWKEALFHHLAATHSVEEMDALTEEDWARGWREVLKRFMSPAIQAMRG